MLVVTMPAASTSVIVPVYVSGAVTLIATPVSRVDVTTVNSCWKNCGQRGQKELSESLSTPVVYWSVWIMSIVVCTFVTHCYSLHIPSVSVHGRRVWKGAHPPNVALNRITGSEANEPCSPPYLPSKMDWTQPRCRWVRVQAPCYARFL